MDQKLEKGGQLTDIDVEEVSLVGNPANKRRFLFTKEDKPMETTEVIKLTKSVFDIDITKEQFEELPIEKQSSLEGFVTFGGTFPEAFQKSTATAIKALMVKEEAPAEKPAEKPAEAATEKPTEAPPAEPAALTAESVKTMIAEALAEKDKPKEGEEAEPTDVEKAIAKMGEDVKVIAKTVGAKLSSETEVEKGGAVGKYGWKDNWDLE